MALVLRSNMELWLLPVLSLDPCFFYPLVT